MRGGLEAAMRHTRLKWDDRDTSEVVYAPGRTVLRLGLVPRMQARYRFSFVKRRRKAVEGVPWL